jgi:hypothetical protein
MYAVILLNKARSFDIDVFSKVNLIILIIYQVVIIILDPPKAGTTIVGFIASGSSSEFEGSHVFILAFIALFYFSKEKYKIFMFITLLLFFNGKRIVFFGTIISAFICYFLINKFFYKKFKLLLISSYVLILGILILFASGFFNDYFLNKFGIAINAFTQGRYYLINSTFSQFDSSSYLFGNGSGFTTTHLNSIGASTQLLHSDVLKIFLEFGLFGTGIFLYFFYYKIYNQKSIVFGFLFLMISISDNILIYNHVMFYYFIIVSSYYHPAKNKQII